MTARTRIEAAFVGILAAAAAVSAGSVLKVLVANPEQLGLDLPSYVEGARRLVETGSPYSAELHAGPLENISTNIAIGYLYPPPLAQLFVPIQSVPIDVLAWAWALAQAVLLLAVLPLVYRRYGGDAHRRATVMILLAAVAFTPNLVALYIGNVTGWIAILVAVALIGAPSARAASVAAAMWLKLTPGVYAVGALLDRSSRLPSLTASLVIMAVSVVLAPAAWADWIAVLPSIVGLTEAPFTSNLAPAHVLGSTGLPELAAVSRIALPVVFGVLLLASALKGNVAAWVAAATGVYLSASGTSWDHYFAVLSPLAAAAWPGASVAMRSLIVGGLIWLGTLRFLDTQAWYQLAGLAFWVTFVAASVIQFNGGATRWRSRFTASRQAPPVGNSE